MTVNDFLPVYSTTFDHRYCDSIFILDPTTNDPTVNYPKRFTIKYDGRNSFFPTPQPRKTITFNKIKITYKVYVRRGTIDHPPTKVLEGVYMVLGSYESRDYILSHQKRILDTCRRKYEIQ